MKLRILILIIPFLISCGKFKNLIQLPDLDPKVQFNKEDTPLSISFVNRKTEDLLEINDYITFSGFVESGLFPINTSTGSKLKKSLNLEEDEHFQMGVSTRCFVNGEKFIFDQKFSKYRFQFSVLELLPKPLLLRNDPSNTSCSFLFNVKDKHLASHHFSLTQIPIGSLSKNKDLSLINHENQDLKLFLNKVVGKDDANDFFLIHNQYKPIGKARFICKDWVQKENIQIDYGITPIFRFLQFSRNTPNLKQNCRILSEKENIVTGITEVFKIDFSEFKNEVYSLDINNLQLELKHSSLDTLGSEGKWASWIHLYKNKSIYSRNSYLDSLGIDYKDFYLFSSFYFKNLPEDFKKQSYKPMWIQVHTKCKGDLFGHVVYENSYEFSFSQEFSLMSVTPLKMLQLYYSSIKEVESYSKHQHLRNKMNKGKINLDKLLQNKSSSICSYKITLSDVQNKINYPELSVDVMWNPGGFGLNFDSGSLKEGYPITHEEILYEELGNLYFTFKQGISNYKDNLKKSHLPDELSVLCGNDKSEEPIEVLNMHLDSFGFFIPASLLFDNPSVRSLLSQKRWLKCRVLTRKNGIVNYFSPEIQIIDLESARDIPYFFKALSKRIPRNKSNSNEEERAKNLKEKIKDIFYGL